MNRLVITGLVALVGTAKFSEYIRLTWPITTPLRYFAITCSVHLTVLLTMERYFAVCQPTFAKKCFMKLQPCLKTKTLVKLIFLFCFLYNIPRSIEYVWISEENGIELEAYLLKNQTYKIVYKTWMYLFTIFILPLMSLAIFNVLIFKKVTCIVLLSPMPTYSTYYT